MILLLSILLILVLLLNSNHPVFSFVPLVQSNIPNIPTTGSTVLLNLAAARVNPVELRRQQQRKRLEYESRRVEVELEQADMIELQLQNLLLVQQQEGNANTSDTEVVIQELQEVAAKAEELREQLAGWISSYQSLDVLDEEGGAALDLDGEDVPPELVILMKRKERENRLREIVLECQVEAGRRVEADRMALILAEEQRLLAEEQRLLTEEQRLKEIQKCKFRQNMMTERFEHEAKLRKIAMEHEAKLREIAMEELREIRRVAVRQQVRDRDAAAKAEREKRKEIEQQRVIKALEAESKYVSLRQNMMSTRLVQEKKIYLEEKKKRDIILRKIELAEIAKAALLRQQQLREYVGGLLRKI